MDSEWAESFQNFSAVTCPLCSGICRTRERDSLARNELPATEVAPPVFTFLMGNQTQCAGGRRLRARKAGQPQQRPDQRMRSRAEAKVATQSPHARAVQMFQHRSKSGARMTQAFAHRSMRCSWRRLSRDRTEQLAIAETGSGNHSVPDEWGKRAGPQA
jgi:hypothetical protein